MKGQDNYGNRTLFLTFSIFSCGKTEKIIVPKGKIIFPNRTFFPQSGKLLFPIFPSAILQRNNEIPKKSNFLGLRKNRK